MGGAAMFRRSGDLGRSRYVLGVGTAATVTPNSPRIARGSPGFYRLTTPIRPLFSRVPSPFFGTHGGRSVRVPEFALDFFVSWRPVFLSRPAPQ